MKLEIILDKNGMALSDADVEYFVEKTINSLTDHKKIVRISNYLTLMAFQVAKRNGKINIPVEVVYFKGRERRVSVMNEDGKLEQYNPDGVVEFEVFERLGMQLL